MKKLTVLLFVISAVIHANAQKRQNVYFLKNNGQQVKIADSSDYVRLIDEPDANETNYNVREFYKSGEKKLIGKVSSFDPRIIFEGIVISYHKNGAQKSIINYKKGVRTGLANYYFENGKIEKEIEYVENQQPQSKESIPKLIFQADSLGKVQVKDGKGHLLQRTKIEKDSLIEEGNYKDGFKDSVWTGRYLSGKSSYTETYSATKLLSGVSTVGDQKFEYTVLESAPQFSGGMPAFYKYLGRTIKYPSDAYTNKISGSVVVNFVVEKDGQITAVQINRAVFPSIDAEALRVVSASPKWIPGMQRGLPVRVKYNIPIKFSLR